MCKMLHEVIYKTEKKIIISSFKNNTISGWSTLLVSFNITLKKVERCSSWLRSIPEI